ncbi:MAG: hypothetical protein RIC95_02360 [Vicingaceae bacterium]
MAILTACAEGNKKSEKTDKNEDKKESPKAEKKNSNLFEIEGKVFSIPSPIQTAFLLKDVGTDYQSDLLNPANKSGSYTTTYDKALALGIYGADLGYATIFDQTQDAISYMAVSKKMAGDLGITGVFDDKMIKRFEENLGNQDSLLVLVSDGFKTTDRYLKNNKQNDLSVLILAGGWIETLHFATSLAQSSQNEMIKNRIGEQKITIKNLVNLLAPYTENAKVAEVANQLNELKDIYAEIEFNYTFKEPTTNPETKRTIINSESNVVMSAEQLKNISAKISSIREGIIN